MFIFKKKSISVKASAEDISKVIKELMPRSALLNSYTERSFSFSMWVTRHQNMYGPIRFIGTIEEHGDECIVKYSLRPGIAGLFGLLVFVLVFLYAFTLLLFSNVSIIFLALSIVFPLIIVIIIMGQEQICDERLIRKLHELEINDDNTN